MSDEIDGAEATMATEAVSEELAAAEMKDGHVVYEKDAHGKTTGQAAEHTVLSACILETRRGLALALRCQNTESM